MSWEDQGRQYHGWFGDGKAPPRDVPPPGDVDEPADALFDPENVMARIDAIGYAAVASLPVADRRRDSATFDDQRLDDLRRVMAAWIGARALTPAAFAARFADPPASDAAIEALRAAAEGARTATTHADLAHASAALAAGMQAIGLSKWPRFLHDAAEQATASGKIVLAQATPPNTATDATPAVTPAAPAPPDRYVSSNPRAWIRHPPVGTGECVPLVRAATGAPRAAEWRRGVQVQGNTDIRPGTAIATFNSEGHYDGHTAIYLGQDAHGIQVIDQWNKRDPQGSIKVNTLRANVLSTLTTRSAPPLTEESFIMSWNRYILIRIATMLFLSGAGTYANAAGISCPPTHDGKPLKDVELFEGDPANKVESMPEPGRFLVPFRPPSDWDRFPPSTLGCTYRGSKDMVVVVLPRSVRVCEFNNGPQVNCH